MLLIKNTNLYSPTFLGKKDILISNGKIVAVEDKITEEELANSLRSQYEGFKAQYQAEAKKAKPDYIDIDKDGDKTEPMKKAVKDKEAK